jgi:hypothetical protein
MIHVLIDTTSLRQLVSNGEIQQELSQIHQWVMQDEITIFCPKPLDDEWKKHRAARYEEGIKSFKKVTAGANDDGLTEAIASLQRQLQMIDAIIIKAIHFDVPSEILVYLYERRKSGRPPYHTNKISDNDAEIFFSSLNYLKSKNLNKLVFVSSNTKEFADPTDTSKLNGGLLDNHADISISYYKSTRDAVLILISDFGLSVASNNKAPIDSDFSPEIFPIDRTQPILLQLHEYCQHRFKNLGFYPLRFLKNDYPFKIENASYGRYESFTLMTDNSVLYAFLKTLNIDGAGNVTVSDNFHVSSVENWQDKVKSVLRHLNDNLIFFIAYRSEGRLDIRLKDPSPCSCLRCTFDRMEFGNTFRGLKPNTKIATDLLKAAYINHRIGNHLTAYHQYERILAFTNENEAAELYFIVQFNLYNLKPFILFSYGENPQKPSILSKLEQIKLKEIIRRLSRKDLNGFFELMCNGQFLLEGENKIRSLLSSIRETYENQITGGWSTSGDSSQLISEYASIDFLIHGNFLIYDSFSDYSEYFDVFAEGLLSSIAIAPGSGSRIVSMDDYLMKALVNFGTPSNLLKYIAKYNLKEIKYVQSSPVGETFLDVCKNFLLGFKSTKAAFDAYCEKENRSFWDHYTKLFSNFLILSSIIDFQEKDRAPSVKDFVAFLKTEDVLKRTLVNPLRFFLQHRKDIDRSDIVTILDIALEKDKYHDEDMFELLGELLSKQSGLTLPNDLFDRLLSSYFKSLESSPTTVCFFYEAFDEVQRKSIKEKIYERLALKFDFELFYRAAMRHIIEVKPEHLEKYIEIASPKKDRLSMKEVLGYTGDKRDPLVTAMLNFSFKLRIRFSSELRNSIANIDPYYSWAMDMGGFDYENFDPMWVTEYQSEPFFEAIRMYPIIKKKLNEYLRSNHNNLLLTTYFKIYDRTPPGTSWLRYFDPRNWFKRD